LIIKTPKDNKVQKRFLGYEWSGAKGQEGIKYNGGTTVNDIITPLFNPKDRGDKSKISYLIQQNFFGVMRFGILRSFGRRLLGISFNY